MCRNSTKSPNDGLVRSSGAGHDSCQGGLMTDLLSNDPLVRVLSGFRNVDAHNHDTFRNETKSIKHQSQGRRSGNQLNLSWPSASPTNEGVAFLPKLGCVTILEPRSLTTITVSWRDATADHYGDQVWSTGVAHKRAVCALTGAHIGRGGAVCRPRHSRTHSPANFDRMILASALLECEDLSTVEEFTRANTKAAAPSHTDRTAPSIQPPDVPATRQKC